MGERRGLGRSLERRRRPWPCRYSPKLVKLIEGGMGEHVVSSMVVARAADIGVEDRHAVRAARLGGVAIEIVVEDGFDRAVGPRADIERPRRGRLDPLGAERLDQPDDAETGSKALFGMGALVQDQLAQRRGRRADHGGVAPDALDRPVGVAPVAGGHVLLRRWCACHCRWSADGRRSARPWRIPRRCAPVRRTSTALASKAIGHAVVVPVDIDVIIDADPAGAPFGEHIGLDRQGLEPRPVEFFEQVAPRHAEPPDRALIVEPDQQVADRLVQLGQAVEPPVAQPSPVIQRSMISTPASTLALSRGRRGRAGRMAVS